MKLLLWLVCFLLSIQIANANYNEEAVCSDLEIDSDFLNNPIKTKVVISTSNNQIRNNLKVLSQLFCDKELWKISMHDAAVYYEEEGEPFAYKNSIDFQNYFRADGREINKLILTDNQNSLTCENGGMGMSHFSLSPTLENLLFNVSELMNEYPKWEDYVAKYKTKPFYMADMKDRLKNDPKFLSGYLMYLQNAWQTEKDEEKKEYLWKRIVKSVAFKQGKITKSDLIDSLSGKIFPLRKQDTPELRVGFVKVNEEVLTELFSTDFSGELLKDFTLQFTTLKELLETPLFDRMRIGFQRELVHAKINRDRMNSIIINLPKGLHPENKPNLNYYFPKTQDMENLPPLAQLPMGDEGLNSSELLGIIQQRKNKNNLKKYLKSLKEWNFPNGKKRIKYFISLEDGNVLVDGKDKILTVEFQKYFKEEYNRFNNVVRKAKNIAKFQWDESIPLTEEEKLTRYYVSKGLDGKYARFRYYEDSNQNKAYLLQNYQEQLDIWNQKFGNGRRVSVSTDYGVLIVGDEKGHIPNDVSNVAHSLAEIKWDLETQKSYDFEHTNEYNICNSNGKNYRVPLIDENYNQPIDILNSKYADLTKWVTDEATKWSNENPGHKLMINENFNVILDGKNLDEDKSTPSGIITNISIVAESIRAWRKR